MRPVKLITGVNVETVMCDHMDSLRVASFNPSTSSPCYMTKEVFNTPSRMHIIPIKHWKRSYYKTSMEADSYGKPFLKDDNLMEEEGYIAVNPEIDETLGRYIQLISSEANDKVEEANRKRDYYWQENDRLRGVIESFDKATFWERLKYLFTGSMKIE
jgi:hypothetical protein